MNERIWTRDGMRLWTARTKPNSKKKIERRKTDSWWQIGIFMMLSKVLMHNHIYGSCKRIMDSFEMFSARVVPFSLHSIASARMCLFFCYFFGSFSFFSSCFSLCITVRLLFGIFACTHSTNANAHWKSFVYSAKYARCCNFRSVLLLIAPVVSIIPKPNAIWKAFNCIALAMFRTMTSSCFKWFHVFCMRYMRNQIGHLKFIHKLFRFIFGSKRNALRSVPHFSIKFNFVSHNWIARTKRNISSVKIALSCFSKRRKKRFTLN